MPLRIVADDRNRNHRLVLSERTVELHVAQMLSKLDLPHDVTANRRVLAVLTQLRAAT